MKEKIEFTSRIIENNPFVDSRNKTSGITLIALVLTIIVLIILATISIGLLFGEDGIIERAKSIREIQRTVEEKERLELAKATVIIENRGKIPVEKYIEELIKQGITTQEKVKDNGDGSKQIITNNGQSIKIETNQEGNIIGITVGPKEGELTVEIKDVQLTPKVSSIKVETVVERGESAIYKYYYKTETGEYIQAYESEQTSCTIERLENDTTYWIKIEAINEHGTVSKEVLTKTKGITKGEESLADKQKIAEYTDQFALIKANAIIENLGKITPLLFIEEVKKEGIVIEEDISINNKGNYQIITKERYLFEVALKEQNDIEVNYMGIVQN